MGQKVNPVGLRLKIINEWDSRWYANENYAVFLIEDLKIRKFLKDRLKNADLGRLEIVRDPEKVIVNVHTARPGVVIGKKGADVEALKKELQYYSSKKVELNIHEIKRTDLSATLVAENISKQIRGRIPYKRAIKQAITNAINSGAKGIKIMVSGRLAGSEMARSEFFKEGRIPLHTFRADVDYSVAESLTKFGMIGVKVWIFRGEVLSKDAKKEDAGILVKKKKKKAVS